MGEITYPSPSFSGSAANMAVIQATFHNSISSGVSQCNYLPMLGLKLNHVSKKKGPWSLGFSIINATKCVYDWHHSKLWQQNTLSCVFLFQVEGLRMAFVIRSFALLYFERGLKMWTLGRKWLLDTWLFIKVFCRITHIAYDEFAIIVAVNNSYDWLGSDKYYSMCFANRAFSKTKMFTLVLALVYGFHEAVGQFAQTPRQYTSISGKRMDAHLINPLSVSSLICLPSVINFPAAFMISNYVHGWHKISILDFPHIVLKQW